MRGQTNDIFQCLVARFADGILFLDQAHRITYANASAGELVGTEPAALIGRSFHDLLPPRLRSGNAARLDAVWATHGGWRDNGNATYEIQCLRTDRSEFTAMVSIVNLTDTAEPALAVCLRDHTPYLERERHWAQLADTDPLTGILNRRAFMVGAEAMAAAAERRGEPFGMALVDIDNFKQINDTYGHAAGDAVIKAVVARMRDTVRDGDLLGRWGGEEFIAALGEVVRDDALAPGERLRTCLASHPVALPWLDIAIPVTVSIGVSLSDQPSEDLEALIKHADAALYEAKADGKDCVRSYRDGFGESA